MTRFSKMIRQNMRWSDETIFLHREDIFGNIQGKPDTFNDMHFFTFIGLPFSAF